MQNNYALNDFFDIFEAVTTERDFAIFQLSDSNARNQFDKILSNK